METKLKHAEDYIETGKFEKAIDSLTEIINAEPIIKAYQLRGFAFYCMHNLDPAVSDLLYVVEHDEGAHLSHFYLAQIYSLMGDFNKAKNYIEKAVAVDHENLDYLGDYVTIEQSLKQYQHSIELCNRILEETPDSNFALIARGYANMQLDNIDSAIDDFEKAVKESPYDFSGWDNLGIAQIKKGEDEKAFRSFQTALRQNPNNPDAYSYMGYLFYTRDDHNKALMYINKSIDLEVTNPNAFKHRALVYIATKETEKAKSDLQHAKELGYTDFYDDEVDELLKKM